MMKELFTIAQKIKFLREKNNMTQSKLAKILGLTRAAVNAWEMGISVPSTQYIIALTKLFGVSADYLLGIENTSSVSVEGLTEKQVSAIYEIILCFKEANQNNLSE